MMKTLFLISVKKLKYSVSFPAVEKEGFGGTARRLVALVHKVNKSNLRDNQVLNAAQLQLTSGIDVQEIKTRNAAVYDLSGRKLPSLQEGVGGRLLPKGVYIVNGKKLVIK